MPIPPPNYFFTMKLSTAFVLAALTALEAARAATVPDYCTAGFTAGTSTVIYTVPYTYSQVMSIIGSYQNLTWSGNPPDTVALDGPDNTVGTTRTYNTAGAHVVETCLIYSKPPNGPYNEVHTTELLTVPSANVSFYIWYDGTVVTPICNGLANTFNFTAHYCGTNGTATGAILSELHMNDAVTAGKFLGGMNFTSCAALEGGMPTGTTTAPAVATYTGAAAKVWREDGGLKGAVVAAAVGAVAWWL